MPYFTPPGGDITANYARSMLGMLRAQPRYQRFSIPAPVVMSRAAQMARAGQQLVMSGMGLGILPTVNVRYAKSAIPAALARRRWNEIHSDDLHGLGKAGASRVIPGGKAFDVFGKGGVSLAPIKRQAGFFMGPGGGPGGGPFQFPGFTVPRMHWLGDATSDFCNSAAADDYFLANGRVPPGCDVTQPINTTTSNTNAPIVNTTPPLLPPQSALVPAAAALLRPTYVPAAPAFFSSSTAGVPNAVLAIGGVALVLLLGKRRRNPSSSRARKYGRRSRSTRRRR